MSLSQRWSIFLGQHENFFDNEDQANAIRDVFYAGAMAFYLEVVSPKSNRKTVDHLIAELNNSMSLIRESLRNTQRYN